MPIPADVQMRQLKKALVGKEGSARVKILKQALGELPGYFSGPHGKLRQWIMAEIEASRARSGVKSRDRFQVPREGDRQIVLLGSPNAGKSSLLQGLTGRQLRVADYPFATLSPTAAILNIKGACLQLVEIPGLIEGADEQHGNGRALAAAARSADHRVVVADLTAGPAEVRALLTEVEAKDLDYEQIILATRYDEASQEVYREWQEAFPDWIILPCSPALGLGLEEIKEALWELCGLVRVYCASPAGVAEEKPVLLDRGATLADFARAIHKELAKTCRFGKVWGDSARFPGQRLGLDHVLQEGDKIWLEIR